MLDVNGGVAIGTYAGATAAPANGIIVSGQLGAGNSAPNAKAIADFSNTTNLGVMLPGVTTANLPAVTAAQNGMIIYNSTIGCIEFVNAGAWVSLASHGSITYNYSGAIQSFTIPACITSLTIIAEGGDGADGGWGGSNGAIVTATVTVVPGHTLDVVAGEAGQDVNFNSSAGGGGASYVWDASSTTYPLVVAGGGGGDGYSSEGTNAALIYTLTNQANAGNAGTAGGGGKVGASTKTGPGGGGGGWNTAATGTLSATTGQGGFALSGSAAGGACATSETLSQGGYGGGGGAGYNSVNAGQGGGGGGGGYNGGGGGSSTTNALQYGGQGGSSGWYTGGYPYTTAANFGNGVNGSAIAATTYQSNGTITIQW
jgi:hypothetical protein